MQKQQQNNKPRTKVSKQIVIANGNRKAAPVATTKIIKTNVPQIKNTGSNVRIRHREFINDVLGSVAFSSSQSYIVNPGLVSTFPWLSSIARRYESYRFRTLRFLFETAAPTSTTGSIILCVDYDPTDLNPAGKTQALSYKSSVRSAPWQPCALSCTEQDLHKRTSYYTRGGLVSTTDLHLYDTGNLFVCVSGQAGATAIGELYVEYDVEFMTPQLETSDGISKSITATTIMSAVWPFGTGQTIVGNLPVNVAWMEALPAQVITFLSAGDYFIFWNVVGTGITDPAVWTAGAGCTISKISANITAGATVMSFVARVRVTSPVTGWASPPTGAWTTVTTSRLYITPCVYTDFA